MGTTRIKVIDLSSSEKEIKTSRKHAEKLAGTAKIKKIATQATGKKPKNAEKKSTEDDSKKVATAIARKPATIKITESKPEDTEDKQTSVKENLVQSAVAKKRQSLHHQGKKYKEAKKLIEEKTYNVKEAIEILPKTSITRFDPSVEIHLLVDDKNIKGAVSFPYSFATKQKKVRYLVFSDKLSTINDKPASPTKPASTLGEQGKPIIWGDEKTIVDIENGKLKPGRDFDTVISSPKFMPSLAKIAKILGPKGMMPNPKNGTITEDFEKTISGPDQGSYQYKSDPTSPVIHAKIGQLSQKPAELEENLKALILAIGPSRIKKGVLASTMSPAIRVDLSSIGKA